MKIIKTTLVAGLISLFATFSTFAEKVKIGDPGWTGATAIANLLAAVVIDKMGGEAELVPGNNTAIYGAIDRSKGEIEVHPDIWLPNQQAYTNDLVPKGTLKLSSNPYDGDQGYCVSQQFAKKFNITAIEDLARPEVVKAMDSDGNGKGEFWIGADGWASANANQVKLRDYGLYDAGIEAIRAAEAVKNARVLDSIKKGEGYAFYCYKPHAIWGMADVVMLEEPKHDPAKYKMVQPKEDADWYKKSYVASKDALKKIQSEGVKRRQVGVEISCPPLQHPNTSYWPIFIDSSEVGYITSAVYSPRLDKNIALAIIDVDYSAIDMVAETRTSEGNHPIKVVQKPFYDPKKKITSAS